MLPLPQTLTVDIATPTIEARPDGALTGASSGAARDSGFAASMLATQPVATNAAGQGSATGEVLPETGNVLPQQIEDPLTTAGVNTTARAPTADALENSTTVNTVLSAEQIAQILDAGVATGSSAAADALLPAATTDSGIPADYVPIETAGIETTVTAADDMTPVGLIDPQSPLQGGVLTDSDTPGDAAIVPTQPVTADTPESIDPTELALQSASLTERELRSLRESVKEQHANGLGLRAEFMGPVPLRATLTRSVLATSMPAYGELSANRVAIDPATQSAAHRSTAAQANAQNLQALAANGVANSDSTAPILTSRLHGIPNIVSSRQQVLPERMAMQGNAPAVTISPHADTMPKTMAPLGNGLPETRITLHGAPQIVDADLKSLQRMLAPSMLHSIPTSPAAAATPQTAATFTPAMPSEVVRPDTAAQNFTRGSQPVTVLTNGSQATETLPVDNAAQNPARGGQPNGSVGGAAQVVVNPSSLSDSIKAALPAQSPAPINQAVTAQAQPNAVPPVSVVAAPRYAKPTASNGVTTPVATVAVAATPGPDLQPVDAAAARPEASNVTLASAAALTAPQPAATTSSATSPPALNLPVTDNAWGNALSERVAMLAGQKLTSADIRLNPAELGPLRIEIKVDDGNAQVHFVAQHAVTRDAIEQALPRLRELLAAEGLNLTGADVSEQGVARDRGEPSQHTRSSDAVSDGETDELQGGNDEPLTRAPNDSLVDTFA